MHCCAVLGWAEPSWAARDKESGGPSDSILERIVFVLNDEISLLYACAICGCRYWFLTVFMLVGSSLRYVCPVLTLFRFHSLCHTIVQSILLSCILHIVQSQAIFMCIFTQIRLRIGWQIIYVHMKKPSHMVSRNSGRNFFSFFSFCVCLFVCVCVSVVGRLFVPILFSTRAHFIPLVAFSILNARRWIIRPRSQYMLNNAK